MQPMSKKIIAAWHAAGANNDYVIPDGSWRGYSILNYALLRSEQAIIDILITKDVGINLKEQISGWSPLVYAVYYRWPKLVNFILNNSHDCELDFYFPPAQRFNFSRWAGCSLLSFAIYYKDTDTAIGLIQKGARVKSDDIEEVITFRWNIWGVSFYNGWTYLSYAVYHGLTCIVKELLKKNCKIKQKIKDQTLIQYAESKFCEPYNEIAKLLRNHIIDTVQDNDYAVLHKGESFIVDKSLFIREIIKNLQSGSIRAFIRPKGTGKSINLSMLNYFFSKDKYYSKKYLFNNSKLWRDKEGNELLKKNQGKYSVIYLNFGKFIESDFNDSIYPALCNEIISAYRQQKHFLKTNAIDNLSSSDKLILKKIFNEEKISTCHDLAISLRILAEFITLANKANNEPEEYQKPIILIDGYDTLLQFFDDNSDEN
ncbi:MAG: AAA family ATPase, partial [Methanobacterium sp.]